MKRESENEILDKHRLAQVGATLHKDRGNEIGQERISESNSGVSWIFRWKVVPECETGNHADMKRKIAEVIQQACADATCVLNHCATKHFPQNHGDDCVEKNITDRRYIWFCE